MMTRPEEVLEFWFAPSSQAHWWGGNAAFDREIRECFGATTVAAGAGELDDWTTTPEGALALVIALDQFPRNMYRGTPQAFAYDAKALAVTQGASERGDDLRVPLARQIFFYMPYQHSEVLAGQHRGVSLIERWVEAHDESERAAPQNYLQFAHRHLAIIERFGRFPHRNPILGRTSTEEEEAFLREPGSAF